MLSCFKNCIHQHIEMGLENLPLFDVSRFVKGFARVLGPVKDNLLFHDFQNTTVPEMLKIFATMLDKRYIQDCG